MKKLLVIIMFILLVAPCYGARSPSQFEEESVYSKNITILSTFIKKTFQRHAQKDGRLKVDTVCIDGYKFAVASTIEIVHGRDGVGGGVAMSQIYEEKNGGSVPMKCVGHSNE